VAAEVDERAVRLASEAGRANLRIAELEAEVERLNGVVSRLQVEKAALAEQLIQMGGGPQ
jgi:predicted  nucleic acid-binding Zn-ribbon protein